MATSEEKLNRDKQRDKNMKKRHHLFAPSEVVLLPLSTPQFHPKTEVRTVFNIVLGKKIPSVPVKKKAWRDG